VVDRDDREMTFELRVHARERPREIAVVLALEQVDDDLCVGVGRERVTSRGESALQLAVVLDDSVEDDRELAGVATGQRVCVLLVDRAVRRPAGVTETVPRDRTVRTGRLDEVLEIPDGADVVETAVLAEGDARRVVAAVLEPAQSAEQERLRLPCADISDDPAHPDRLSFPAEARKFRRETRRARLSDLPAASREDQPSSWLTSAAILAQSASASSRVSASARRRTTGSVPEG